MAGDGVSKSYLFTIDTTGFELTIFQAISVSALCGITLVKALKGASSVSIKHCNFYILFVLNIFIIITSMLDIGHQLSKQWPMSHSLLGIFLTTH